TLPNAKSWPSDLDVTHFAGPSLVPSPACLAVAPSGEVFVGVDMIGSLGKEMGKGRIVRLVDTNNDGRPDFHNVFVELDNPRSILAIGDRVIVLHTTFSPETRKASRMNLVVIDDKNGDGIAAGAPNILIHGV